MTNVFSDLNGKTKPAGFRWMNEPRSGLSQKKDWLYRLSRKPTFQGSCGTSVQHSAHFLYTLYEGDFTFMTKVEVEMLDDYDAAVMMIMVDDDHWAKLCYEFTYKKPMIVSVVTKECPATVTPWSYRERHLSSSHPL